MPSCSSLTLLMGSVKDDIKSLKRQLAGAQGVANNCSPPSSVSIVSSRTTPSCPAAGVTTKHIGKAPPI